MPLLPSIDGENFSSWLSQTFYPTWLELAWDGRYGGWIDRFDMNLTALDVGYKRMRLQGRQLFFTAYVGLRDPGLAERSQELLRDGLDFCESHFWDNKSGGWYARVSNDGKKTLDESKELYCQAFGLFGLAWAERFAGDGRARVLANETFGFLDAHMATDVGGYDCVCGQPTGASGWREQNPHMHLLEACLAWYETSQEKCFLDRAKDLVDLWLDKFTTADSHQLAEYFDVDWAFAPAPDGFRREPGHQFEWFWLLYKYFLASDDDRVIEPARSMMDWALSKGLDAAPHGMPAVFDEIDCGGHVLLATKRLWPNTEYIKSLIALGEWHGVSRALRQAAAHLSFVFEAYRLPNGMGFTEHWDRSGREPIKDFVPTSSIYHLTTMFDEVECGLIREARPLG